MKPLELKVQPIYGKFRAMIQWVAEPRVQDHTFIVRKSPDGINDWRVIGQVVGNDHYIDEDLLRHGRMMEQYYRVTAVGPGGKEVHSDMVGTFGRAERSEFGAARQIMELEYTAMKRFTQVHLLKLKTYGPMCPACVDEDTDQSIGVSLCERCWGTSRDGGYHPPALTYMRIMTISPVAKIDSAEGAGSSDPSLQVARMLAYPMLRKEDLLIDRDSDRRYVVDHANYALLAGKIPVVATVNLRLLQQDDVRYRIPL
jgi:hypothetical protein